MRFLIFYPLTAYFLLSIFQIKAQNLIINPSFEAYSTCPNGPSTFAADVTSWSIPDTATTDYYNVCYTPFLGPSMDVPSNVQGYQNARTGVAYAGIICRDNTLGVDDNWREYVQGHLNTPLVAGQTYCVKYYWSLADLSNYSVQEIGVYLSPTQINLLQKGNLPFTPQLELTGSPLNDTSNWVMFQQNYIATGGEQYVIIGNFRAPSNTTSSATAISCSMIPSNGGCFAYYYIDDVSVTPGECCLVDITPVAAICVNDPPITLISASAGGTWSGVGVNPSTGIFDPFAAGAGIHSIIYTLPCGADTISISVTCCAAQINPAGPFCTGDAPVNLSAGLAGGTWTGTGITSASAGTFSPSIAGVGSHSIIYTVNSCGSDTLIISVSACITLTACQETNGNITVTNGTGPYTWTKDSTYTDCSGCFGGACIPGFCNGVTATILSTFANGTTIIPPGTYPVTVTDASSNTLIITSLSSLPNCSNTCPTLTVSVSNIVQDSCFGQSAGSFSVSISGGVSPWDYTLVNSSGATVDTFANVVGTQSFTGLPAGIYTLNVLDTNNCPGTTTITITQPSAATTVAAAGADQSLCGNSATLSGNTPSVGIGNWTLISGTGTITTPSSSSSGVTGLGIGISVFEWTISNPPCPSSSDQITITNTGGGPTVTITTHSNISCYGESNGSATAFANGGTGSLQYFWTATGGSLPTANNLSEGTYTITVTDSLGCAAVETIAITQPDSISAIVTTTPTACGSATGAATVTASGGTGILTYLWTPGGASTLTINNSGAGLYSVTITDSAGCTKTSSGIIATNGGPTANAGNDVTITSGYSTQLSAIGGGTYFWTPATGLNCDTCQSPTASPVATTIYCVTVSVSGCNDSDCVTIIVLDTVPATVITCGTLYVPVGSVFVPNAFTPNNNDALNDVFKPVANCVHDYNFLIFNRWGEKIFETTDPEQGWNGYYKGILSKPDVYVYKISYMDDPRNDFHQYTGKVVLLR